MYFKGLIRSALVAAAIIAAAYCQSPPNKGKQVIDQAVAALGGERFLHMHSRVASGRIYAFFHDELSGLSLAKIYVEYLPDASSGLAVRERELLGKKQDYSYLFLTDQAWDVTFRGARPVPDEDWQRYARTTQNDILYLLRFRLNEPGIQYEYAGSDVYLSRHVEIVDIIDAKDQTIRVFFDHNTMLPVHQSYSWLDPATRVRNDEVTEYDKYRDAGGIKWPFSIERARNGYKVYQMFADQVQVDQPLPPAIFDLPSGAKILKKVN
jgi:hypothetical protein